MTRPDPVWRPILEGERAERARSAVDRIVGDLNGRVPDMGAFSGGKAGIAFLHGMRALARKSEEDAQLAEDCLDGSIAWLAEQVTNSSLYSGYTGVAWAMEALRKQLWTASQEGDDPNEDIDLAIQEELKESPWAASYDLIQGLAGIGMYLLERLPNPVAAQCLATVVDRFAELSEPHNGGVRWLTPVHHLVVRKTMERYPEGYYNLGVAHGVPGIVTVLAGACAGNVAVDRARPLLEGAVRWIISEKLPAEGRGLYPSMVAPGHHGGPSRSAWCYGDPGVAATLLLAGDALGDASFREAGLEAALHAARLPSEHAGVVDPGLCHGTAGLAHIFNRMYHLTGNTELRDAALLWFDKTFEFQSDIGIGGFQAMLPVDMESGKLELRDDPGFLTGSTGIALTLLAGISPIEPTWDRILAVSTPSRGEMKGEKPAA